MTELSFKASDYVWAAARMRVTARYGGPWAADDLRLADEWEAQARTKQLPSTRTEVGAGGELIDIENRDQGRADTPLCRPNWQPRGSQMAKTPLEIASLARMHTKKAVNLYPAASAPSAARPTRHHGPAAGAGTRCRCTPTARSTGRESAERMTFHSNSPSSVLGAEFFIPRSRFLCSTSVMHSCINQGNLNG